MKNAKRYNRIGNPVCFMPVERFRELLPVVFVMPLQTLGRGWNWLFMFDGFASIMF